MSKKAACVGVLFSFLFVGCGESESNLEKLALERCQSQAESFVKNQYFPYEKVVSTEIISFEKHEKRENTYNAECKINYILKRDYGKQKKGDDYFEKRSITVKKAFDNATGTDKWFAN